MAIGAGKRRRGGQQERRERKRVTWANMWLRRAEVGPGYDRFAWLAHIRQIHGGIEISNRRNPTPLFHFTGMITRLLDVTRGGTSRGPRCCCCYCFFFVFFFHGLCCDLDGLSTGDLSMVYPSHEGIVRQIV